jgi:hypothetical protein
VSNVKSIDGRLTNAGRQEFYEILCHLLRWAEDENALAHRKLQKLFGVGDAPTSAYRSTALHGREELKRWLTAVTSEAPQEGAEKPSLLGVDELADKLAAKMLPALKAGWDAFAPPRSSTPTDFFDHRQRTADRQEWASLHAGAFNEGVIVAIEWKNDGPKGNAERIGPREINGTLYDIYVDSAGKAWAKRCVGG